MKTAVPRHYGSSKPTKKLRPVIPAILVLFTVLAVRTSFFLPTNPNLDSVLISLHKPTTGHAAWNVTLAGNAQANRIRALIGPVFPRRSHRRRRDESVRTRRHPLNGLDHASQVSRENLYTMQQNN